MADFYTDDDLDKLYNRIDTLLRSGDLDAINEELRKCVTRIDKMCVMEMIGYLTITFAAAKNLSCRPLLVNAVRTEMARRGMSNAEIAAELYGL